ncbi:MAG TPA: LysM domain-containing protein [Polyangiales bacterium]|nr:LysM domain-containing protein [Polyangiales bacterium]
MSRTRRLGEVVLLGCALAWSTHVRAEDAVVHVVRPSETLAAIAELYYGDPRREAAIVAENSLGIDGGSAIVVGLRLVIPTVRYHRVLEGETWAALAERYYGDVRRAFALIEANSVGAGKQPAVGAQLLIPHPLRYVSSSHDPVRQAAREFYDGSNKSIAMLRRFNGLKGRVGRGDILLLPLANLVLSEQGRKLAQEQGRALAAAAEAREGQLSVHDELPALHEHVQLGRYVEAVALANRLLGMGHLTGNQLVTIERELGTALVALDREDLALEAFKTLLERQPDVELGLGDTSPRVLHVLDSAKRALAEARNQSSRGSEMKQTQTASP